MEEKESIAERLEAIRKNIGDPVVIEVGMCKKNKFEILKVNVCYPKNKKSKKKETKESNPSYVG